MALQEPKKAEHYRCIGLLAHVDAGKTTLSEAILYTTGTTRKLGRVDQCVHIFLTHVMQSSCFGGEPRGGNAIRLSCTQTPRPETGGALRIIRRHCH